jgi:predicted DsbA family dithiol-disulfide isomerase
MRIEVWADVVCAWAYIGKRRLERALAEPAPPDDLAAVGDAVAHIDQELKPYR